MLAAEGQFDGDARPRFVWWLPGVLVANAIGTSAGLRLPQDGVPAVTLGLAFAAGVVTAVTA